LELGDPELPEGVSHSKESCEGNKSKNADVGKVEVELQLGNPMLNGKTSQESAVRAAVLDATSHGSSPIQLRYQ
jgi:hypothetical protein